MQEKLKAQQEKVQRDLATALNQRVFLDLWIKDLTLQNETLRDEAKGPWLYHAQT